MIENLKHMNGVRIPSLQGNTMFRNSNVFNPMQERTSLKNFGVSCHSRSAAQPRNVVCLIPTQV